MFSLIILFRRFAGPSQYGRQSVGWALAIWLAGVVAGFAQPAAPSGLTATTVSTTQINLAWTDNAANELGFRIERSPDSITFAPIATNLSNVITYAATNLSPAIKYYFRVRAFNGSGNSAYANTNSATTWTPWAQWSLGEFTAMQLTNAAVSGLTADPDGDGMANVVEYALNQEPLSANAAIPGVAGLETILATNYLTLTYTGNASAIDVQFFAKVSSNLTEWVSGTNVVNGPIPVATNGGTVTAKFRATAEASAPCQFLQFGATYTGVPDSWEIGLPLPAVMVEMACAWLGDKLYVNGMTNANFPTTTSHIYVYDITSNSWTRLLPERPFTGDHHAMEVLNGRVYLVGGLDGGSDGKVQIYDPATNGWSLGTSMPFATGAGSSAVINGKIYYAGGIIGETVTPAWDPGTNTHLAAVYDPGLNNWTMLAPLPVGMNHTAAATDGTNFYVFGGRDVGNIPDNGFNTVQIYNPTNNTWVSSSDPGSTLAPLPAARGGMGKAIYYKGEFYVMGGETVNGAGSTVNHVYNRVDIYNVASNTWRLGTPMPTARHGIWPALRGNRIYVPGGGVVSSISHSAVMEIYVLP